MPFSAQNANFRCDRKDIRWFRKVMVQNTKAKLIEFLCDAFYSMFTLLIDKSNKLVCSKRVKRAHSFKKLQISQGNKEYKKKEHNPLALVYFISLFGKVFPTVHPLRRVIAGGPAWKEFFNICTERLCSAILLFRKTSCWIPSIPHLIDAKRLNLGFSCYWS